MDFHDPEAARCRKNTPKKQRKYTAGETRRKIGGKSFSRKKSSLPGHDRRSLQSQKNAARGSSELKMWEVKRGTIAFRLRSGGRESEPHWKQPLCGSGRRSKTG